MCAFVVRRYVIRPKSPRGRRRSWVGRIPAGCAISLVTPQNVVRTRAILDHALSRVICKSARLVIRVSVRLVALHYVVHALVGVATFLSRFVILDCSDITAATAAYAVGAVVKLAIDAINSPHVETLEE